MQTSSASIYAMVISIIVLAIAMITCLGLFYIKKKNAVLIFLIGTLGYLLPQILIRYPLISFLQISVFPMLNIAFVIFILSFSTALFETIGRFFVIKIGLKKEQNKICGALVGLGHGFCEALFLLVITYVNNLFIVYLAQLGGDSNQINLVLSAIENVPLDIFYFTLLERLLYIAIQMGLSSFMMNGILKNKKMILLFVFGIHFIMDICITSIATYGVQIVLQDILIGIIALLSILYMWKFSFSNNELNLKLLHVHQENVDDLPKSSLDLEKNEK